jgi:DNA repair protein RadC
MEVQDMKDSIPLIRVVMETGAAYESPTHALSTKVTCSDVVASICRDMQTLDRERCDMLALDSMNGVLARHIVSIGSLSASLVHPREVYKAAVLCNAASIVLVHNHPSGNAQPSREDEYLTGRIRRAGDVLGIPLVDHIIIGNPAHYSFADNARLATVGEEDGRP